ncbi:MAG: class I SAM-dependent methyltransferase [Hyphomicrobiales bacterium]|nr:class I SAM-dependent methyltransferase [Hyphomicrobiales bacterium]
MHNHHASRTALQASTTALGAAAHRAAHQIRDGGAIFTDPLAVRILGADAEGALARAGQRTGLRFYLAARSRFAEDAALRALADGTRQIVVLGAGLDTFALRAPALEGLTIYECDQPASLAEKRRRLAAAGIEPPAHCRFAVLDLRAGGLVEALAAAGFEPDEDAFFLWLGVTPYLPPPTTFSVLAELAALPGGVEIVFDYINPPQTIADAATRRAHERLAERVRQAGEPFCGALDSGSLHKHIATLQYDGVEDLGPAKIAARYFPGARRGPRGGAGAHFIRLTRPGGARSA